MNSVFVLAPGEDWIVDRFVKEWNEDNADISVQRADDADVIWLMADWCWQRLPVSLLRTRKVITTVHHIVPHKFGVRELADFQARDQITTVYHVPNKYTCDFIKPLTSKPVHVLPYWANQSIWHPTATKFELRQKHKVPLMAHVVGSFQRDTEGAGIAEGIFLPKLEKGPDLLADYVKYLKDIKVTPHVVLAGWRRQYLIERLQKIDVTYTYFERPTQEVVNELYQTLDIYPVSARYEGGPQSLVECGLLGVKCVSRPIGIADQVLPDSAINENLAMAIPAIPNVEHMKLLHGYEPYRQLIALL